MKNNRTLWILAAMWAAMLLFMYSQNKGKTQVILPLNTLVKQAQDAERSAGNDAGKLKRVVGQYEAIAKIKQYKQSEEAADSLLRVGIIYETKLKNENQAVNTYQRITRAFSPEKSRAGAEAKTRLGTLKAKMDRRHAKDIGYKAIDWLVAVTGRNPKYSYALALLIITIIFKAITTPLSHAQYKSMKEMQRIQPLVKQLQAKYKDNQHTRSSCRTGSSSRKGSSCGSEAGCRTSTRRSSRRIYLCRTFLWC
ncbi:MAG: YidC/Oxa1 family membrane protein insertase [Armatimonadetes bacterium]|nr:YidC/Oxa1 family membrane protein insertase [Armatimonadota bacterium]